MSSRELKKYILSHQEELLKTFNDALNATPASIREKYSQFLEMVNEEKENIFGVGFISGFGLGHDMCTDYFKNGCPPSESYKELTNDALDNIRSLMRKIPEKLAIYIHLLLNANPSSAFIQKDEVLHIILLSLIGGAYLDKSDIEKALELVGGIESDKSGKIHKK